MRRQMGTNRNLVTNAAIYGGIAKPFKVERRMTITAAKDLRYGEDVIQKLKEAKDSDELTEIMRNARKTLLS